MTAADVQKPISAIAMLTAKRHLAACMEEDEPRHNCHATCGDLANLLAELDRVMQLVHSDQFHCVGRQEDEDDMDYGEAAFRERLDGPRPLVQGTYDANGYCTEMLTVSVEHERGEFGTILSSAVVVEGACADWHHYSDGEGRVYDEILTRYSERRQLLKRIESSAPDPAAVCVCQS